MPLQGQEEKEQYLRQAAATHAQIGPHQHHVELWARSHRAKMPADVIWLGKIVVKGCYRQNKMPQKCIETD